MKDSEIRLASLISGRGSTIERIIFETQEGELIGKVRVVAVIADRFASGISKAPTRGIPGFIIDKKIISSSEACGEAILKVCKDLGADFVMQNGWLSYTPENVISSYEGRIYNQHPAPLDPENRNENGIPIHFGGKGMHGLAVHSAVLKFQGLSGRNFPTEATIHEVTAKYDEGKVVYRKEVPVCKNDTPETLAQRVLPHEHQGQIVFLNNLYNQNIRELKRGEVLIKPDEEQLLEEAKQYGVNRYNKKQ